MTLRVLMLVTAAGLALGGCNRDRDDDRYGNGTTYRSNQSSSTWNNNTNTTNRTTTGSDTAIRSDYRDNASMQTQTQTRSATAPSWQSDSRTTTPANQQGQTQNSAIRAIDRDFVTTAAMDGMKEVEMGRLGVRNASDEKVKQFAQKIIDDHTKANDELMTLARSKNIDVTTQLPADHKTMVETMNQLSGADFDRQFISHMAQDHQKAVDLFDRHARQGEDAQVRAFAARTLPTLRQHLQMARDLQVNFEGSDLGIPRREPTTPTAPATPTTPTNPGSPNPIQPLNPDSPGSPTNPNPPFDPNNPTQPPQPTTPPSDPLNPNNPTNPSNPPAPR